MRKGLNIWLFGIILASTIINVEAQDPLFSLYESNPVYINPGKVGRYRQKAAIFNQRFQSSTNSTYNTSQVTFILPIYLQGNYAEKSSINHDGGLGASIFNDVSNGAYKCTGGSISAAYNWRLDPNMKHLVSFGLTAGFMKVSADLSDYTWGEQYDDNEGFNGGTPAYSIPHGDRTTVLDAGFGAVWAFRNKLLKLKGIKSAEAGISLGHLNSPNISVASNNDVKLPIITKAYSHLYYAINEKYFTGVKILYLQQQSNMRTNLGAVFGVNFEKSGDYISESNNTTTGFILLESYIDIWMSANNSFGLALNLDFTNYKIGLAYESNYSTFSVNNKLGSAFELFLQANIPSAKK